MIHYAIPSHARAERINGWALKALADAGVPADAVAVFVAPDELDQYRGFVDPGLCGELLPGALGLQHQRAAIVAYYGEGAEVVQLDDDIRAVVRRVNHRQLAPCTDLPREAADAFGLCAGLGARLWGVYPTPNAGWMKARVRTGLSFICGGLYGQVCDPTLDVQLPQKEDYERTLRYFKADGNVLRVEWLGFRSGMYNPGGMQAPDQPDRSELNAEAVAKLLAWYPEHVRVAARVGKAGAELRLYDGRRPRLPLT